MDTRSFVVDFYNCISNLGIPRRNTTLWREGYINEEILGGGDNELYQIVDEKNVGVYNDGGG